MRSLWVFLFSLCSFFPAYAASHGMPTFTLLWGFPFLGILLSLSIFPLINAHFWHKHYGKVVGFWTSLFLGPLIIHVPTQAFWGLLSHVLFTEYIPFLLLIGSLFIVTSGIELKSRWKGTPLNNTLVLLMGTMLSSLIGTTGASLLLIRPLIHANAWRHHKMHIFIFFIFLVANIGGALSPLGDPPLFLGFLQGVPFFWFLQNLWDNTFFVAGILLGLFFILDFILHKKERKDPLHHLPERFQIRGKINLFFLGCIVGAILLSGSWKSSITLCLAGTLLPLSDVARDVLLLATAFFSFRLTKSDVRHANHFTWDPLVEIGKVFFGLFLTVTPVISFLQQGSAGPLKDIVQLAHSPSSYFWLSGLLSSVLDNAPTYLVFFFMAGGQAADLTTTGAPILSAISQGCVFFGALTYIGNAPNFMIKSILESRGVTMPSFFGYLLWSLGLLIPIFFFSEKFLH